MHCEQINQLLYCIQIPFKKIILSQLLSLLIKCWNKSKICTTLEYKLLLGGNVVLHLYVDCFFELQKGNRTGLELRPCTQKSGSALQHLLLRVFHSGWQTSDWHPWGLAQVLHNFKETCITAASSACLIAISFIYPVILGGQIISYVSWQPIV